MSSETIIYEQPLNELIRAALRFEYLFKQLDHCLVHLSPQESAEIILAYIINIIDLFDRPDLKSKLTKEFHRHKITLSRLSTMPGVNQQLLQKLLDELQSLSDYLLSTQGKIAQPLREDPFIINIRQHFAYPGDCSVDSPLYHYWLNQPAAQLDEQIYGWLDSLAKPRSAIDLLLKIARQSSQLQPVEAEKGFYYKNLDASLPWQMVRVAIEKDRLFYPEISAGKHRVSVRFIASSDDEEGDSRGKQTDKTIPFELSCCTL